MKRSIVIKLTWFASLVAVAVTGSWLAVAIATTIGAYYGLSE